MNVAILSPANGKFDAGGVNLYLKCLGQGSPTVVLDAGYGFDSSGHFIQQNEPQVVIDAILKLVEKAQQQ